MRKRLIELDEKIDKPIADDWLDLARLAEVELTSEDAAFPIESALGVDDGPGWRAASSGEQIIRIVFDEPQPISRIHLVFEESDRPRTQEFAVRWSPGGDEPVRDIVRQQWNFHPPNATREVEDYNADLTGVKTLELAIVPDTSGGSAQASLRSLRIA